mgnify:CR=1 FL=1
MKTGTATTAVRGAPIQSIRLITWAVGLGGAALVVYGAIDTQGFLTGTNVRSVLAQSAFVGVFALATTVIMISGNLFSLSLAVTGAVTASSFLAMLPHGQAIAILSTLAIGTGICAIQGCLVGAFGANPIIVTIAAGGLQEGIFLWLSGGATIVPSFTDTSFQWLNQVVAVPWVGPLPLAVMVFIALVVAVEGILRSTRFGQLVYFVGENRPAAIAAGIPTAWVITGAFGVAGLLTAIVGVGCTLAMFAAAERERRASDSLRRTDEALQLQSARFEAAIENMSQGLCMFDEHRKLVVSNRRYATLYRIDPALLTRGTPVEKVLEYRVAAGAAPRDAAAYVAGRLQEAHENQAYKVEHELLDGRVIAVSHEPLPDGGWVATHEDITEQKRAETRIAHMAHHDALTGLPNRVVLAQRLRELLDDDENPAFAVLALDLDLFKRVNDTLGHQYGDLLLGQVAQRLRDSTRETDLVVRLGGDEFAIVQLAEDQPHSATALSERVIAVLNQPFDLDGHQIVIGTSIGDRKSTRLNSSHT